MHQKLALSSLTLAFLLSSQTMAISALFVGKDKPHYKEIIIPPTPRAETEDLFSQKHFNKVSKICKKHSAFGAPIIRAEEGETFATFRFLNLPRKTVCSGTDKEGITLSRFDIKTLLNKASHINDEEGFYAEESLQYHNKIISRDALLEADKALNGYYCTPYERIRIHFTFSNPLKDMCPN